jgi:FlaA1/EpsC-like NDP-sugar epimerase
MFNKFEDKKILVTGGTGSIGSVIVRKLLEYEPKVVRILSRDEFKQYQLMNEFSNDPRLRFLIGDIREKDRLDMAMEEIDIVFHAAAMKHVLFCENDPFEAVKTNVLGTQNVINSALANKVEKVIGISTDKAADPISVMGCTKLLAEKMMLASYRYKGTKQTKFCFVRFGNVLSTRGSILPLFYKQIQRGGPVTITDNRMYRFFISINQAVELVF